MSTRIRVVVRKRPLNGREAGRGEQDVVEARLDQVVLREPRLRVDLTQYVEQHRFRFDAAFGQGHSTHDIYEQEVRPMLRQACTGARVTCFAYGQTGSGKTFTLLGSQSQRGLYSYAVEELFGELACRLVLVSFYEIYCGKLYDLLNERKLLVAREDSRGRVNVVGLHTEQARSAEGLLDIIEFGSRFRKIATNSVNVGDSSRSHAILQMDLGEGGRLTFIDLAGSQRAKDHGDESKETRLDGAEINKSLLALKECIRALDRGKSHTPFRGSKLTLVLRDSFIGDCRTLMIGNISPSSACCEHTLNTLRYADRVKELHSGRPSADPLMLPRASQSRPSALFDEDPPEFLPRPRGSLFDTEQDEEQLLQQQNKLIETILRQEEDVMEEHRKHMEEGFSAIKAEMGLLRQAEELAEGEYREALGPIVEERLASISRLRALTQRLRESLRAEREVGLQLQALS